MHKNKVITASFGILFFLFSGTLCCFMSEERDNLMCRKQCIEKYNIDSEKFISNVSKQNIYVFKSYEKIFNEENNIKNVIEKIAERLSVKKILFKNKHIQNDFCNSEIIEIKFASTENKVYEFIKEIYKRTNGLMIFDSIKLTKSVKKKIIAEISCRIFNRFKDIKQCADIKNISHFSSKSVRIFEKDKKHILNGVMQKSVAFVDKSTKRAGDMIGDYQLIEVGENWIKVRKRNKIRTISLRECF